MLTNQETYVHPLVERLLKEITLEQSRFDRDLRAVKREKIVLPVVIRPSKGDEEVFAFTRDLSVAGACLISNTKIEDRVTAVIQIYRLKQEKESEVIAEMKWCKPFGPSFWISGWQFLRIPRG